jgi:hypothetical protein
MAFNKAFTKIQVSGQGDVDADVHTDDLTFVAGSNMTITTLGDVITFTSASGGSGGDVVDDTTPQLGGDLDVNGKTIASVVNGDITIAPHGSGDLILDGHKWPQTDGTNGQVLTTDGAAQLSWASSSGSGGLALTTATATFDKDTSFWSTLTGTSQYGEVQWDTGINLPASAVVIGITCQVTTVFNNMAGYEVVGPFYAPTSTRVSLLGGHYSGSYGISSYYSGQILNVVGTATMGIPYVNGTSAVDLKLNFYHSAYSTPTAPTLGAATVTVHYLS